MITTEQISALYRQFPTTPALFQDCGISALFDICFDCPEAVDFDGDSIIFRTMPETSPLRRIEIEKIHGVATLGSVMAVVLASSIIFINLANFETYIHLRDLD